jgi:uncharacterized protein YbjT (DUF2867 family)
MTGLVLVTGATGKTGRSLVAQLKDHGLAHRAASRSGERPFDWTRPETWDPALEGVGAIYLVAPPTVDDPYSRMIAFLQAAKLAGVARLVFLSMASLPAGGFAHGQVHQWLKDNSEDWAVLGPSAFMQNFTEGSHLATIRDEDTIYSNTRDGRVSFISADDIACAAFALLTGPGGANRDFVITGDEALSYDQVADRIGQACGRRITHARISSDELVARFLARGIPDATARFLAFGYEAIAGGAFDWTTNVFETLTGVRPTTFQAFAAGNAQVWERADRQA